MAAATITTDQAKVNGPSSNIALEALKAPFFLRCAALIVDYLVLLIVPVLWLLIGKMLSEGPAAGIPAWVWSIGVLLFLCNFVVLPLLRGRTAGKILLGLTILNLDGTPLTLWGIIKRDILGYFATLLTGGLGFLLAAVHPSGRALHDLIAGTIVIKGVKVQV